MSDDVFGRGDGGTIGGGPSPSTRSSEHTIRLDTVLDLLRDSRRRYVLYVLDDADDSAVPFESLVEGVRNYEAAADGPGELPPRQTVRTNLVHVHLPQLASVDVLDHDPRHGRVRFHGDPLLEEWAAKARRFEFEWDGRDDGQGVPIR